MGINTWVSSEPVLNVPDVISFIECADFIDVWKVGKLNYHQSDIDWSDFGHRAETLLRSKKRAGYIRDYYIKNSLRKEMNG